MFWSKKMQSHWRNNLILPFQDITCPESESISHDQMGPESVLNGEICISVMWKTQANNWQVYEVTKTSKSASESTRYLCEPFGTFEIESLSMSLWENSECFRLPLVQLTGTMTENARMVMGPKIFSLQQENNNVSVKGQKSKIPWKWLFFFFPSLISIRKLYMFVWKESFSGSFQNCFWKLESITMMLQLFPNF